MQQMFAQSAEPKGVGVCTGVYPGRITSKALRYHMVELSHLHTVQSYQATFIELFGSTQSHSMCPALMTVNQLAY